MNTSQPIKNKTDLKKIKAYYKTERPNPSNHLLIVIGLNTALRISDILSLKWGMVYDLETDQMRRHITISEQKTGKFSSIYVNDSICQALTSYMEFLQQKGITIEKEFFLFPTRADLQMHISRVQAHRIIKKAATECCLQGTISCHSLRKTFGYFAWKQGTSPVLLMTIYNHSSFQVTKRYLGIEQDERDTVFQNNCL